MMHEARVELSEHLRLQLLFLRQGMAIPGGCVRRCQF
jgi:hypothetical protein